jgi:hypothetical protein
MPQKTDLVIIVTLASKYPNAYCKLDNKPIRLRAQGSLKLIRLSHLAFLREHATCPIIHLWQHLMI